MKEAEKTWTLDFKSEKAAVQALGAYKGKGTISVHENKDGSWRITIKEKI